MEACVLHCTVAVPTSLSPCPLAVVCRERGRVIDEERTSMSLIWILVWLLYRALEGYAPQLRVVNFWLLTLAVAAIVDALHYRRYVRRGPWR